MQCCEPAPSWVMSPLPCDDLMVGASPITHQLIRTYLDTGSSVLAVQDVPREQTKLYGIVAGPVVNDQLSQVTELVEKPHPDKAPSTLAVAGRYVLTSTVFDYLTKGQRGVGGEIQLTDAIEQHCHIEKVFAHRYKGRRYDCGSKHGLLQACVDLAEQNKELGATFTAWLQNRQPLQSTDLG